MFALNTQHSTVDLPGTKHRGLKRKSLTQASCMSDQSAQSESLGCHSASNQGACGPHSVTLTGHTSPYKADKVRWTSMLLF